MSYPPLQYDVIREEGKSMELHVTHHVAQSYSRSIDPAAKKKAREVLRGEGTWELFDVDYGMDSHTGNPMKTRSVYFFRKIGSRR